MNEDNKENQILLEAIENYEGYSVVERKILKVLVRIMINSVIITSAQQLSKLAKVSKTSVYPSIKRFEKDGLLSPSDDPKEKLNKFMINKAMLEDIVKRFQKQKSIQADFE